MTHKEQHARWAHIALLAERGATVKRLMLVFDVSAYLIYGVCEKRGISLCSEDEDRDALIADRIRAGKTNKEIRKEFGVSYNVPYRIGKKTGVKLAREPVVYNRVHSEKCCYSKVHPFRILAVLRADVFLTDTEAAKGFSLSRERISQIRAFASSLGLL